VRVLPSTPGSVTSPTRAVPSAWAVARLFAARSDIFVSVTLRLGDRKSIDDSLLCFLSLWSTEERSSI